MRFVRTHLVRSSFLLRLIILLQSFLVCFATAVVCIYTSHSMHFFSSSLLCVFIFCSSLGGFFDFFSLFLLATSPSVTGPESPEIRPPRGHGPGPVRSRLTNTEKVNQAGF